MLCYCCLHIKNRSDLFTYLSLSVLTQRLTRWIPVITGYLTHPDRLYCKNKMNPKGRQKRYKKNRHRYICE